MSRYKVKFYTGSYAFRQGSANADKCVCYVEHHFNASITQSANYSLVVVGSNASRTSKEWGKYYANSVAKQFDIKSYNNGEGIIVGGFGGRGDGNIRSTNMPAILLEPMFCTNPQAASIIKSEEGQKILATILIDSITTFFPQGGLVGFSIGHKGNTARPGDLGAAIYGGGWEADYAEKVLDLAKMGLEWEY